MISQLMKVIIMRFSIYFNDEELQYLSDYMKKRKIKSKPTAIKKSSLQTIKYKSIDENQEEIIRLLNKNIHYSNLIRMLLEQLFVNVEFNSNKSVKDNKLLKEFYEYNSRYRSFME